MELAGTMDLWRRALFLDTFFGPCNSQPLLQAAALASARN